MECCVLSVPSVVGLDRMVYFVRPPGKIDAITQVCSLRKKNARGPSSTQLMTAS